MTPEQYEESCARWATALLLLVVTVMVGFMAWFQSVQLDAPADGVELAPPMVCTLAADGEAVCETGR